ncbi:DUF2799 domain-containing protein [Psychrobacter sp. FDAARGOS_221]|uniref:DUF2799 domain-containing protein n=1 Tax=Psychrobacter sp. FDAARGOS_221 TaxID=1975705 RepID=UPI000BB5897D|nr:DUF2799 domain-containing protein [Psychrobacter sp. FDAARGOS_221]PNK60384.1 DUF2799 domain-containing protein [Psychrobacter sp. FDAARGOS_221]
MKGAFWLLGIIVSVPLLTSCATLSKEECLTGNWESIGYADGAAGRSSDHLNRHNKACAKVGVATNYQMWEKGRQQGLKQYCTATNAYQLGKRGSQLNAVCPASVTPKLDRINADGRRYYSINQQIVNEKKKLKEYTDDYESLRNGSNLDFTDERDARSYLIELPPKIYQVQERIDRLEYQLQQLQQAVGY